jgi:hypothetical protein
VITSGTISLPDLSRDPNRIQGSLTKPDGLADARKEDNFDLAFEVLLHKSKQPTASMIYIVKINFLSQILTADNFKAAVAQPLKRLPDEDHTEQACVS